MVIKSAMLFDCLEKDQIEFVKNHICEDDQKLEHLENLIAEWVKSEPHLPQNYDKTVIKNMIRGCKFNLEKAKKKIEYHFVAKSYYNEVYANRDPTTMEILDVVNVAFLPKLTEKGRRVILISVKESDPSKLNVPEAFKLLMMLYELALRQDMAVCGETTIIDCKNLSAPHITKVFSPFMKTIVVLLREAYAIRIRELHFVNHAPLLETLLNGIKPLMHPKVGKMIIFHQNYETLWNYYSKDILPSTYGGNGKSLENYAEETKQILIDNHDWFKEQENVKLTGPIPKKMKGTLYFDDQLGVEGSFRKLEID